MTHIPRHLRRALAVLIASAVACVLTLALVLPAHAETVYNFSEPVNGTVFNPCNGETITFSGTFHDAFHLTFDNGGGVNVNFQDNAQGITGIGDQGNTYTGNEADHESFNAHIGAEETAPSSFQEISHGSAPNFILHTSFHFTVNADGTVTAFHDNLVVGCQG